MTEEEIFAMQMLNDISTMLTCVMPLVALLIVIGMMQMVSRLGKIVRLQEKQIEFLSYNVSMDLINDENTDKTLVNNLVKNGLITSADAAAISKRKGWSKPIAED